MSRALVTAYAASAARVASWLIVFGLVYRASGDAGQANLGTLALARASVGLLGYASLGITPVLVRLLTLHADDSDTAKRTYATAVSLVFSVAIGASFILLGFLYSAGKFQTGIGTVFLSVGLATLIRSASDTFASALLAAGQVTVDNLCQVIAEVAFVVSALLLLGTPQSPPAAAGWAFLISAGVLLLTRLMRASKVRILDLRSVTRKLAWPILLPAGGVLAGQLADWLYAPLNQILIGHRLGEVAVGPYAVAIQIDGGLLLLVSGIATVMLPNAAIAARENRWLELRRNYVQAWLGSLFLLAGASAVIVMLSAIIFQRWFGNPMPAAQAILSLVLIHTTIGGTAGISRAVLLGIGRVKAYTLSAVIGGVANAVLAYVLLTQTSLGINGVIWATIITVFFRCGLWMPWFTLRCLRPTPLPPAAASSI